MKKLLVFVAVAFAITVITVRTVAVMTISQPHAFTPYPAPPTD